MKHLTAKLTYSNVISTLCLVLLLGGGTAYAATQLGRESVGARQLKKNAVTPAKLNAAAKKALTGPTGPAGSQGKEGSPGVEGPRGEPGTDAAPGAFATVLNGTPPQFLGTHPGFTAVERKSTGVYCLTPAAGIDYSHPIASVEWSKTLESNVLVEPIAGPEVQGCAAGHFEVHTFEFTGAAVSPSNTASFTVFAPQG